MRWKRNANRYTFGRMREYADGQRHRSRHGDAFSSETNIVPATTATAASAEFLRGRRIIKSSPSPTVLPHAQQGLALAPTLTPGLTQFIKDEPCRGHRRDPPKCSVSTYAPKSPASPVTSAVLRPVVVPAARVLPRQLPRLKFAREGLEVTAVR